MVWVTVVFWVLLVPLAIILAITYATTKETFRLFYILSIFTYVMTVLYYIDKYGSNKNFILIVLVASAILMLLLGTYFAKKKMPKEKKPANNLLVVWICVAIIIALMIINNLNIGLSADIQTLAKVSKKDVLDSTYENKVTIQRIEIKNEYFLAKNYELPQVRICLYNTASQKGQRADGYYETEQGSINSDNPTGIRTEVKPQESRTVTLSFQFYYLKPIEAGVNQTVDYDKIYIIPIKKQNDAFGRNYFEVGDYNCNALTEETLSKAVEIDII